jgi:hypothetical protein
VSNSVDSSGKFSLNVGGYGKINTDKEEGQKRLPVWQRCHLVFW